MIKIFLTFIALSFASPTYAFLCDGESVRCIDYNYNPGREYFTYNADTCSSYVDYHSGPTGGPGVTIYYAYCSEHPCGGQTVDCTDYSTNPGTTRTFVNVDSCRDGYGYCAAD